MSSAMYGWGGEAFFCPRRLPCWENARGERWPYQDSPYAGTPLCPYSSSAPIQPHIFMAAYGYIQGYLIFHISMYFLRRQRSSFSFEEAKYYAVGMKGLPQKITQQVALAKKRFGIFDPRLVLGSVTLLVLIGSCCYNG